MSVLQHPVAADRRPVPPRPRGPLTARLLAALAEPAHAAAFPAVPPSGAVADDDLQLALHCCYELHYRGLAGVDERWEWEPSLLAFRQELESVFEQALERLAPRTFVPADEAVAQLWDLATTPAGPSLSRWLLDNGDITHAQELAMHRSAYQRKEADPHTWGIPRLTGRPKAAMVAIQADEYGGGTAAEMHAERFAVTMSAIGLDPTYGAHIDWLPAETLATDNLISFLGLHRRHRGALAGHLALFEMTSVGPMGRYSQWMERLGVGPEGRAFYDVHVTADEHHQHVAADELVGGLMESEPELASDVVWGARLLTDLECRFTQHCMTQWGLGRSSLREGVAPDAVAARSVLRRLVAGA